VRIHNNVKLESITGLSNLSETLRLAIDSNTILKTLNGLQNLKIVKDGLRIRNNNSLENTEAISSITSVEEDIIISFNDALTTLNLDAIGQISGNLEIRDNKNLTQLLLSNLSDISKDLIISKNDGLASLAGFDNLTSIGGNLRIFNNQRLETLSGLQKITTVGGGLGVGSCHNLQNLSALSGVMSIGDTLAIFGNDQLTSLEGIENIDPTTISALLISGNQNLSTCDVKSICDYLKIPQSEAIISNNDTRCNSINQVAMSCQTSKVTDSTDDKLKIAPNPTNNFINVSGLEVSKDFVLFDVLGKVVMNGVLSEGDQIDISFLENGLYFIKIGNTTLSVLKL
jgi:hypothetical protein